MIAPHDDKHDVETVSTSLLRTKSREWAGAQQEVSSNHKECLGYISLLTVVRYMSGRGVETLPPGKAQG